MAKPKFEYEIVETLGIIGMDKSETWTKEVNIISWNDKEPKIDIRSWSPDHTKMSKGITLSKGEAEKLKLILQDTELN